MVAYVDQPTYCFEFSSDSSCSIFTAEGYQLLYINLSFANWNVFCSKEIWVIVAGRNQTGKFTAKALRKYEASKKIVVIDLI
jgi:hypothetical protein